MLSISCCSNNPTSSSTSFSQRPLLLNLKSCRSIREVGLRRSIRATRVSATTIHGIICHAALTDTRMSSHLAPSHLLPTPGVPNSILRYHIQYHSDYVPMLPQPQLVREVYSAIATGLAPYTQHGVEQVHRSRQFTQQSVSGLCFTYVTPLPDAMTALTPTSLEPRLWGVPPLPLP